MISQTTRRKKKISAANTRTAVATDFALAA